MDKEKLVELRKKSTSGNIGEKKEHPMKITREEYLRRIKLYISLTAIGVAFTIGGGKLLANKLHDKLTINTTRKVYYDDLIGNGKDESERNWHPTDEGGAIWYDYGEIAHDLKNLNADNNHEVEFDIGVSSLLEHLGEEQTDTVLRYTDYEGLKGYLDVKGYTDSESFQKEMDDEIVLNSKISKQEKELNEMRNDQMSTKYAETDQEEMTGGSK